MPEAKGFIHLPALTRAFSLGVLANPGYVFRRITLRTPLPLEAGLRLAATLAKEALCGTELRIPHRLSREDFASFNRRYITALQAAGLSTDPSSPAARTNMVPLHNPPADAVLHAFTYAVPQQTEARDFLLSGKPELNGNQVIAPNDTSPKGMQAKADFVLQDLQQTAAQLGANWTRVTGAHIYTQDPIPSISINATHIPGAPPIFGPDFEMDARAVTYEETV